MRRSQVLLCGLLCELLVLSSALAGAETAANQPRANPHAPAAPGSISIAALPNYVIDWCSVNSGGAIEAASTNLQMGMSVGQSAAGETSSASYKMGIGFWYGVSTCLCPCHGDPQCDGVHNVQDVVQTVNVAFRGYAPVFDPQCPKQRSDVNCDGVTTVVDVVKVVNVAFRGANPATEFCDPCAP